VFESVLEDVRRFSPGFSSATRILCRGVSNSGQIQAIWRLFIYPSYQSELQVSQKARKKKKVFPNNEKILNCKDQKHFFSLLKITITAYLPTQQNEKVWGWGKHYGR
jgi:hypothetical protein